MNLFEQMPPELFNTIVDHVPSTKNQAMFLVQTGHARDKDRMKKLYFWYLVEIVRDFVQTQGETDWNTRFQGFEAILNHETVSGLLYFRYRFEYLLQMTRPLVSTYLSYFTDDDVQGMTRQHKAKTKEENVTDISIALIFSGQARYKQFMKDMTIYRSNIISWKSIMYTQFLKALFKYLDTHKRNVNYDGMAIHLGI